MGSLQEELEAKVNLKELLDNLEFTEQDIARAALTQPKLYYQAGRLRMQKLYAKNKAEVSFDLLQHSLTLRIRETDSERVKEKGVRLEKKTETHLKEMVSRSKKFREKLHALKRATEEEAFAKMMLEAYDMRMQAIKVISNLSGMERVVEKQMRQKADELSQAEKRIRKHYDD